MSDANKKRIELIGPNYIKPKEVAYYKQMLKDKKLTRRNKKTIDKSKTAKKKRHVQRETLSKMLKPIEPPAEYRANCPNIACLSSVDAEDTLRDELRFTCFKCGCDWSMSRRFAFRVSDF